LADGAPIASIRRTPHWQTVKLCFDLIQAQPQLLGDLDEGQAANINALKAPLLTRATVCDDQTTGLIEADCRDREADPIGDFSDAQNVMCLHCDFLEFKS
jgi:hypothetical protein